MRIKISLYIFIQHFHLLCRRRVCTYFHGLFRVFRQHHINLTPHLWLLLKFTFNLPFSTLLFFPPLSFYEVFMVFYGVATLYDDWD